MFGRHHVNGKCANVFPSARKETTFLIVQNTIVESKLSTIRLHEPPQIRCDESSQRVHAISIPIKIVA